jgi:hypothetical protein
MADAQTQTARRGGGLSRLVLWLLVLGLLAAVWWLASERNLRRFSWRPDESVLVIAKGRFFPLGMANIAADDPHLGKVYGPIPIPQGAKVSEQEFDDQTALDRALFDLVVPWARAGAQKGEEKSIAEAGRLIDRANALPGLTAEQHQQLAGLRGELAYTAARQELLQAAKLVLSARRKLQSVEESGGEHALEAGPMLRELEGIQGLLEDASQSKSHPAPSSPPRQPTAPPKQAPSAPDAGTPPPTPPR